MQGRKLCTHRYAQFGIKGGERFIQKESCRIANDRPFCSNLLALAVGQLARPAFEVILDDLLCRWFLRPGFLSHLHFL